MNYEKKYKEALERAKNCLKDGTITNTAKSYIEEIFPELRESDERIRKGIVKMIYDIAGGFPFEKHGIIKKEALAWLEKQGEQKSVDKVESKFNVGDWIVNKRHSYLIADIDYLDNRYLFEIGGYTHEQMNWEYIKNADEHYHLWSIQDAKLGDVLVTNSDIVFLFKFLDEEGTISYYSCCNKNSGAYFPKIKERLCDQDVYPATKEQRYLLFQKMEEAGYMWDAEKKELKELKKVEQKPVDKVKSKFKIGDWVTFTRNDSSRELMFIYDIRDGRYYFDDMCHFSWSITIKECDSKCHLWTIQDAKPGDVLVDEDINVIGIFEGIEGMCWHSKFYYSNTTKEFYGIECGGSHQKEFAKPATKEQCNLLFSKMKEAGYEWDAEKKELKLLITNGGDFDTKNCEQKPTWSDEDERIRKELIQLISCMHDADHRKHDWLAWLEKQKPVELRQDNVEELTEFECAMMHIGGSFFGKNAGLDPNDTTVIKEQAKLLTEMLPKKEWSEEDEKTLTEIFLVAARASLRKSTLFGKNYDYIKWQNWLKSLKQRINYGSN